MKNGLKTIRVLNRILSPKMGSFSQMFSNLSQKIFINIFSFFWRLVLTTFSKSSKYPKDMYSGLIATYFKEDLLVQSWRNGAGEKLDSDCTDKYKVQNIDRIGMTSLKSVDWNSTEDHSKWVISSDSTGQSYTCISDINRMKSQFKRGGGSLCIHSNQVWKIFKKTIEGIEGCPTKFGSKKRTTTTTTERSVKTKRRPKEDNSTDG